MEITICLTFLGGKGHCNLNVIPSDFETFKFTKTSCAGYNLKPGTYSLAVVGVSPAGGTVIEVSNPLGTQIARKEIKKEGNFSRFITITI